MGFLSAPNQKDFWVCWTLNYSLDSFGDMVLFKRGTSLSKVFQAISRRMSIAAVDYANRGRCEY